MLTAAQPARFSRPRPMQHVSPAVMQEFTAGSVPPLVELRGVTKSYGASPVLNDVDLSVFPGEVVVLLGPSGAGKSTLCRVVNRLEPIDRGEIMVDGTPVPDGGQALVDLRGKVGMVFQSFNLFTHMTVLENVTIGPRRVLGWSARQARERAFELLERVHIADLAHKYPATLSGGQQQRAAIARALAVRPKVMLFDEPTSALDPEMVSEVVDVMADLASEGMTMIIVSHEIGFAKECADRCVFMADGRIVETAPPSVFFSNPVTARAREFLSKVLR